MTGEGRTTAENMKVPAIKGLNEEVEKREGLERSGERACRNCVSVLQRRNENRTLIWSSPSKALHVIFKILHLSVNSWLLNLFINGFEIEVIH